MNTAFPLRRCSSLALALAGASLLGTTMTGWPAGAVAAGAQQSAAAAVSAPRIVAMRRLTEAQYRNAIADIFGPDINVAGRFEPIVRPVHELIASGSRDAALSPLGLEQFDGMARNIAAQVFDAQHRG